MTEIYNQDLLLGYDLDMWEHFGSCIPITVDTSPKTNSHILLTGMSGSGKTYAEILIFTRLILLNPNAEFHFADYKGDDSFYFLRNCSHYYPYKNTLNALEIVHNRLQKRLSGEDTTRNQVTLIWDEYVANILNLQNEDKTKAKSVMNMVSEILMLGRSLAIRLCVSCQRPDAIVFPAGSRLNYGVTIVLGAMIPSIYNMLMPEFIEQIEGREFQRGEGTVLLQGSKLHFIKIPTVTDERKMQALCVQALS